MNPFKWCSVRYLYPPDHNPARITKADKDFSKKLVFKDISSKFQSKLETFRKLKKRIPSALVFLVMKIRKNIQFMYQKNARKTCSFIIIEEKGKRHYVLQRFQYIHLQSYFKM